jgi:hypothetical protein
VSCLSFGRAAFRLSIKDFAEKSKEESVIKGNICYYVSDKSKFVERFPEFSLFYRLFSPLDSEMICIFPYFYPCEESAREIREIFI